jgi:transposase
MNYLSKEKTMTIKEIAEILHVSNSSVKRAVKRFFPKKMTNGKTTYLNEVEVTIVKKELERHHNHFNKSLNTSELNMMLQFLGGKR